MAFPFIARCFSYLLRHSICFKAKLGYRNPLLLRALVSKSQTNSTLSRQPPSSPLFITKADYVNF